MKRLIFLIKCWWWRRTDNYDTIFSVIGKPKPLFRAGECVVVREGQETDSSSVEYVTYLYIGDDKYKEIDRS